MYLSGEGTQRFLGVSDDGEWGLSIIRKGQGMKQVLEFVEVSIFQLCAANMVTRTAHYSTTSTEGVYR